MPLEDIDRSARRRIPGPNRSVLTPGCEQAVVATEGHTVDCSRVPAHFAELLFGRRVPELDLTSGRRDLLTVWVKRHGQGQSTVASQDSLQTSCRDIPQSDGLVPTGRRQDSAVLGKRNSRDDPAVSVHRVDQLPRGPMPDAHHSILACSGDVNSIGTACDGQHAAGYLKR